MTADRFSKPVAWLLLAAIVFVTVSPIGLRPHTITSVNIDRALAYLVVGLAFALAYPRHWPAVAALLVIGAVGIELLQYLSPTRHARMHDAAVKAVGACIGVMLGMLVNRLRRQSPAEIEGRDTQGSVGAGGGGRTRTAKAEGF
jgi:VanZ family protein